MPYNISGLKTQLEKITGKKVFLFDNEELLTEPNISKTSLEKIAEKSFNSLFYNLAVKNLYLYQIKKMLKNFPEIKNEQQLEIIFKKNKPYFEELYEKHLVIEDLKTIK